MNELQIFNSEEFGEIRTVTINEGLWFVGKDIATALGYAKPENAIATHVSDEDKTSTLIQGSGSNYKSKAILINESGLYALIFGSKLESAKRFKHWVTSEVLPAISKTGSYQIRPPNREKPRQISQELKSRELPFCGFLSKIPDHQNGYKRISVKSIHRSS